MAYTAILCVTVLCLCTTSAGIPTTVKTIDINATTTTTITTAKASTITTATVPSVRNVNNSKDPKELARQATLELSKEIFRNISKQLRDSIAAKDFSIFTTTPTNQDDNDELHPFRHQIKHHHERHWGPYFDEPSGLVMVSAHLASEALLNCRVGMLRDKTVMWLRRGSDKVQLLTVGETTYSGDNRVSVKFQYPNNWRLRISPVKKEDKGLYLCQVSTHPPRVLLTNLTVIAPVLRIVDEQGQEVGDRYYKAGSSMELSCRVSRSYTGSLTTTTTLQPDIMKLLKVTSTSTTTSASPSTSTPSPTPSPAPTPTINTTQDHHNDTLHKVKLPPKNNFYGITWHKDGKPLVNKIMWKNSSSTFRVLHSSQSDSGQYTCSILNISSVTVQVHVLVGETHAAVHHDTVNCGKRTFSENYVIIAFIFYSIKLITYKIECSEMR